MSPIKDLHSLIDLKVKKKNQETKTEIAVKYPKHIQKNSFINLISYLHVELNHTKFTNTAFKFLLSINSMVCKAFFDENK